MRNEEVIKLLQHQRHDLMNHIQILQGYLSMKKEDKVNLKLNDLIDGLNEERKLMNLETPAFNLWVIKFNYSHQNIRLSYNIHTTTALNGLDKQILNKCDQVVGIIGASAENSELYELILDLDKKDEKVALIFSIKGYFKDEKELLNGLEKLGEQLESPDERMMFKFLIPNE